MSNQSFWRIIVWITSVVILQATASDVRNYDTSSQLNLPLTDWLSLEDEVKIIFEGVEKCNETYYSCSQASRKGLCSCNDNCMTYADCCPKTLYRKFSEGEQIASYNFSCISTKYRNQNEGFLMISSCQDSFINTSIEELCQKKVPLEMYDHTLDLPVISLSSNLTYQNYFCSLCNNDSYNLENTTLSIRCRLSNPARRRTRIDDSLRTNVSSIMLNSEYIPYELKWAINNASIFPELSYLENVTCHLQIEEFGSSYTYMQRYGGRNCYIPDGKSSKDTTPNEIENCGGEWSNSDDAAKCRSYATIMMDTKANKYYKNPHCAICNNVNITSGETSCSNPTRDISRKFTTTFVKTPPISILFSINNYFNCRSNMIWDALANKCKDVGCGSSFQKSNGKCRPRSRHFNVAMHNVNCSDILLGNDSYLIGDNSSSDDALMGYSEYQINGSNTVVCRTTHKARRRIFNDSANLSFFLIAISEVFLAIHIVLFFASPKKKSWNARNLNCLSISLFIAQLIFMFGVTYTENFEICLTISICLHFFWLASFFWMNILSVDVFKTFHSQTGVLSAAKYKTFVYYSIYGWGGPFTIVATALAINSIDFMNTLSPQYVGYGYNKLCWMTNRGGLITFFVTPVSIMVLSNIILFFVTSLEIFKQHQKSKFALMSTNSVRSVSSHSRNKEKLQKKQERKNKIRLAVYLKLGILQGITWSLVFLTIDNDYEIIDTLFSVCNSLQGTLIFLCFDLKPVWIKSAWNRVSSMSQGTRKSSGSTQETNSS